MLDLTDPQWSEFSTHTGPAGWVPQWLEELTATPDDLNLFDRGRWCLWSDENTWSASFAAAPYLVSIAARTRPEVRIEYVKLLALMAMYRTRPGWQGEYMACPPNLEREFEQALGEATILVAGLLPMTWSDENSRMLIAGIAAFKGYLPLARTIEFGQAWCPSCEKLVECPMYSYDK